ncbi:MAG TPA: Rieske 2Fe-2S domain-containing protein [Acetobacteraceae bacterium]|nr:Rieske 2Fe-2S domain-containing protein [Acetobacteraceae bacterium]
MDQLTVDSRHWQSGLTRVPYWVYQDPDLPALEQRRIFEGPVWNFLCLETEIANPGDWRTTFIGSMPVVVARTTDGAIAAFENRCAHRGALICLDNGGRGAKDFQCVYHAWRYDLCGNLASVAFRHGVNGKGGMPSDFRLEAHGPRKLRTTTLCGLVFGTLSAETPPLEDWLGAPIVAKINRVLGARQPEIIGRFTQALPNNWKLYAENVKDTYHASLLHLFFATFRINRLSLGGGVTVSESGGHHASATRMPTEAVDTTYQGMRSVDDGFRLADPSMLQTHPEFGDDIQLQILALFPCFVLQQIRNCIAVRQVTPRGLQATDLDWIFLGFTGDTPELRTLRLKQCNLVGPAGYVSMEDGCVGGFVQRGIAAAAEADSVVEMGGDVAGSQDTRATEAAVRGFWKQWRATMGI